MDEKWVPLSVREGWRDPGDLQALHQGAPDWLRPSIGSWFEEFAEQAPDNIDLDTMTRFAERKLRRSLGSWEMATRFRTLDEDVLLDLVNFLIIYATEHFTEEFTDNEGNLHTVADSLGYYLESILEDAGSAWTVKTDPALAGLFHRVPEEVVREAETAMLPEDRASLHLREAWTDIFGRNPDPSDGYGQAVKAVEAVAKPIVLPNDQLATLGKMIGVMRATPTKWMVNLEHNEPEKQVKQVVGMMELLWKGQHDRHGKSNEDAPFDVSQPEAEAAIHLAVTLVQWFRSGVIEVAGK